MNKKEWRLSSTGIREVCVMYLSMIVGMIIIIEETKWLRDPSPEWDQNAPRMLVWIMIVMCVLCIVAVVWKFTHMPTRIKVSDTSMSVTFAFLFSSSMDTNDLLSVHYAPSSKWVRDESYTLITARRKVIIPPITYCESKELSEYLAKLRTSIN